MTKLLKNSDYINLGANDLVKKAVEILKKEEEKNREIVGDKND